MTMKKFSRIFAALAAIVLVAAASVSCDKHAYSISTNHFGYYSGTSIKEIGNKHTIKKGNQHEVFAVYSDKTRIEGGVHSSSTKDDSKVRTWVPESGDRIVIEGASKGSADVTLNFEINGFKLYKTVTVKVE